jgi:hypothetical protein
VHCNVRHVRLRTNQSLRRYQSAKKEREMPVLLVPVLWVAGSAILLGGGYFVIAHAIH